MLLLIFYLVEHCADNCYSAEEAEKQGLVGPQVGPGILPGQTQLPPALAASLPSAGGGTAFAGSTISAGPTGPSSSTPYQAPPSGPSATGGSGPAIHPARLAAIQQTAPPPLPDQQAGGQTRPREEETAGAHQQQQPSAKRAKVDKLEFGLYNEIDWQSLHPEPITLSVQLPIYPEKPEWKLNGSVIDIPDVPVTTLFSTVRDRIKKALDAELPISRMRIEYNGKVMNNQSSLASLNIGEGDMVVMSLKKK